MGDRGGSPDVRSRAGNRSPHTSESPPRATTFGARCQSGGARRQRASLPESQPVRRPTGLRPRCREVRERHVVDEGKVAGLPLLGCQWDGAGDMATDETVALKR